MSLKKNRRHLGSATSARIPPGLHIEAGHHHPAITGLKGDGARIRVTGVLSYANGIAEFDALSTDDEDEALQRIFHRVADRVHAMLLDDDGRRRKNSRTAS